MISLNGTWYDGKTSARVAAVCRFFDNGGILVESMDGGDTLLSLPRFEVEASSRLANTPRYLCFPGGEKFETDENDTVDRLLTIFNRPHRLGMIHRLERRWRSVAMAITVLILFMVGSITYGIPAIAKALSFKLPSSVLRLASEHTLKILDQTLLHPSELEVNKQNELLNHFRPVLENHRSSRPVILFRKGDRVGPNAFALPNGTIVFTDEMVRLSDHAEELVAVLVHELGHIVHRHGMRSLVQDSLLGFVLIAITGDVSGSSELFLGLPVLLTELAYSRQFEQEADEYALHYLQAHQIPPHHFATLMKKIDSHMKNQSETTGKKWRSYLSTHPETEKRMQRFQ